MFEDAHASCQKSLTSAQGTLGKAKEELAAYEASQEAQRVAAEEEGLPAEEVRAEVRGSCTF